VSTDSGEASRRLHALTRTRGGGPGHKLSDPAQSLSAFGNKLTERLEVVVHDGALYRTFKSTNPIENLNGLIARYTRNVKRW